MSARSDGISLKPHHLSTSPIQEWIEAAKQGDQKAFSALLDQFWPAVYGFQLKRTEDETEAEDIAIQSFSKAFDQLEQYNPDFAFQTWLIAISKNLQIDLLRKKKSRRLDEIELPGNSQADRVLDETPTAEDLIIQQQNLKKLLGCIKQLKPAYQEVIQLRYFQELPYKDIAVQLNESLSSVKVKLLRAKRLLAEIIRLEAEN